MRKNNGFQQFSLIYGDIDAKDNQIINLPKLKPILAILPGVAIVAHSVSEKGLQFFVTIKPEQGN